MKNEYYYKKKGGAGGVNTPYRQLQVLGYDLIRLMPQAWDTSVCTARGVYVSYSSEW